MNRLTVKFAYDLLRHFLWVGLLISPLAAYALDAAKTAPVYLYRDDSGAAYTYSTQAKDADYQISETAVSAAEIDAIRKEGFDVSFLDKGAATDGLISSLPSNFSIIRRWGIVYGVIWTSGTRPANKTTQWLTFNFTSYGFSQNGEHAAISLFLDASALTPTGGYIVGNGITIGDLHGRTDKDGGCGSTSWPNVPIYNSQVEAYWIPIPGFEKGNWIYGASCGTVALQDATTYHYTVQANTGGWVAYWTNLVSPPAIKTLDQRPSWNPNNGGVLFTSTGPGGRDFTLNFTNVSTGWF